MLCPLCHQRKARRACPALNQQICSVCCGTKRLTEIACPADCVYLAAAREHPAAAVVRQHQHDLEWLVAHVRDLGERQSRLFFLVCSFLARYSPDDGGRTLDVFGEGRHEVGGLQRVGAYGGVIDQDVADALGALAATLETSARGVIYEHRAASVPAERLVAALKPVLAEVGRDGGTAFERDAAVVLRRLESAARAMTKESAAGPRAFVELLDRVIRKPAPGEAAPHEEQAAEPDRPRLILP